ncbi:MAG: UDP-N-acetylglucosamine 1-carboxyvinyltransferase [Christensenellaceae bacterium]
MQTIQVRGRNRLEGTVRIQPSKNAALPMMAACLLTEEPVTLTLPRIRDVSAMKQLLSGWSVDEQTGSEEDDTLVLCAERAAYAPLPQECFSLLRSSSYLLGAGIARFKEVLLPLPGGCDIGARPLNYHFAALSRLGVSTMETGEGMLCRTKGLHGASVRLPFPSVGATVNLLSCAALAEGESEIFGYAKEPEVFDYIAFLCAMGARIREREGSLVVEGVPKLHSAVYRPMPDRIELDTFRLACALTGGEIVIEGAGMQKEEGFWGKSLQKTCKTRRKDDKIIVKGTSCFEPLRIETGPWPAFPTDLQPLVSVLATQCREESILRETVFERRFTHLGELSRMGASVRISGDTAFVSGRGLHGERVVARDLRGGAALVLAGLVAEGETLIQQAQYIDRGYSRLEEKLSALGAKIGRIEEEDGR